MQRPASPRAALAALLLVFGLAAAARVADFAEPTFPTDLARPAPQSTRLREGVAIDLNVATESDLALLPRIGPALAKRIVAHRARVGRFADVDALREVRGCGPKTLDAVRPYLTVGAASSVAPPASSR